LLIFYLLFISILKEITLEESFEAAADQGINFSGSRSDLLQQQPQLQHQVSQNENAAAANSATTGGDDSSVNQVFKNSPKLATLAESATNLGTFVSKTVYALNDEGATTSGGADQRIASKTKKYPNINFSTLYHSLINIIEIIPNIQPSQIGLYFFVLFRSIKLVI
jgi:hypothetical protein